LNGVLLEFLDQGIDKSTGCVIWKKEKRRFQKYYDSDNQQQKKENEFDHLRMTCDFETFYPQFLEIARRVGLDQSSKRSRQEFGRKLLAKISKSLYNQVALQLGNREHPTTDLEKIARTISLVEQCEKDKKLNSKSTHKSEVEKHPKKKPYDGSKKCKKCNRVGHATEDHIDFKGSSHASRGKSRDKKRSRNYHDNKSSEDRKARLAKVTCHACGEKGHYAGSEECPKKGEKFTKKVTFDAEKTKKVGSMKRMNLVENTETEEDDSEELIPERIGGMKRMSFETNAKLSENELAEVADLSKEDWKMINNDAHEENLKEENHPGKRILALALINGQKNKLLVDNGSDMTIIDRKFCSDNGIEVKPFTTKKYVELGKKESKWQMIGMAKVTIRWRHPNMDRDHLIDCYVGEDSSHNSIIIGLEHFSEFGIQIAGVPFQYPNEAEVPKKTLNKECITFGEENEVDYHSEDDELSNEPADVLANMFREKDRIPSEDLETIMSAIQPILEKHKELPNNEFCNLPQANLRLRDYFINKPQPKFIRQYPVNKKLETLYDQKMQSLVDRKILKPVTELDPGKQLQAKLWNSPIHTVL
jgi:hypothetical protein